MNPVFVGDVAVWLGAVFGVTYATMWMINNMKERQV